MSPGAAIALLLACTAHEPVPVELVPPSPAVPSPPPAPEPEPLDPEWVYVRVPGERGSSLGVVHLDGSLVLATEAHLVHLGTGALYRFDRADLLERHGVHGAERRVATDVAAHQLSVDAAGEVTFADLQGTVRRLIDGSPADWSSPLPLRGTVPAAGAVSVGLLAGFTPQGAPCIAPTATPRSAGPKEVLLPERVAVDAWPVGTSRVCAEGSGWAWHLPITPRAYPCTGCLPTQVAGPHGGWLAWRSNSGSQPRYTGRGATHVARIDDLEVADLVEERGGWPDTRPVAMSASGAHVLLCADRDGVPGACGIARTEAIAALPSSVRTTTAAPSWTAVPGLTSASAALEAVPLVPPAGHPRGWPEPAQRGHWEPRL